MENVGRNCVIVLGGSIAGLLAARVLADSYAEVIVVDRDDLGDHDCSGDHDCPRRSIPQGYHVHALLARGLQIIEELLPGITEEMIAAGAVPGDVTGNVRWIMNGRRMGRPHSGMLVLSVSRPCLEQHVRARVRALPNVRFLERHDITGLLTSDDNAAVIGVSVADSGAVRPLLGDLVVDATGRGSRTPVWLRELGYPEVENDKLKIGLGYATQYYRLPPDRMGDDMSIDMVASASLPRGAICARIDGGRALVTAYGILGDHPPTDPEGFLTFLKSLSTLDIYDAVQDAEPLYEPVAYRFPTNLRRHYERMTAFPDGLLILGDAVCSFNPVYGQGMTVAALGAMVLRDHVGRAGAPRPAEYFADLAKHALDHVWNMTLSSDLAFPNVEGERSEDLLREQDYVDRVLEAAARHPFVLIAFARVIGLIDPPDALTAPEIHAALHQTSDDVPLLAKPR